MEIGGGLSRHSTLTLFYHIYLGIFTAKRKKKLQKIDSLHIYSSVFLLHSPTWIASIIHSI